MKKNFIIIGCGRFGASVATTLYDLGYDVLAVDSSEETIRNISDKVTHAVQADATDEEVLRSLGISNFDVAIVSIASKVQSSILATILVKELGIPYVLCKAKDALQAKVLYKIGADKVVFPEKDMGVRVANSLVSTNILEYVDLDPEYSIAEIVIPKSFEGKSIAAINFRAKYGVNIVAIKEKGGVNFNPDAALVMEKGDILIVIGSGSQIRNLEKVK